MIDLTEFAATDTEEEISVGFEEEPTRVVTLHQLPDEAADGQHRRDLQRFFVSPPSPGR